MLLCALHGSRSRICNPLRCEHDETPLIQHKFEAQPASYNGLCLLQRSRVLQVESGSL